MNNFIKQAKKGILELLSGPIEDVDLNISKFLKSLALSHDLYSNYSFYSEEQQSSQLEAPLLLLDPIDGTREFRAKIHECCVSLSFLTSFKLNDQKNIHWIWNFFNDDEVLFYDNAFKVNSFSSRNIQKSKKLLTFISRSDYEKYDLSSFSYDNIQIEPVGSIAYKLALMNAGLCDFIISLSNKHIWDICAGSMLLSLKGYQLYINSSEQTQLNDKLLAGPMYWIKDKSHKNLIEGLIKEIQHRKLRM